MSQIYPELRRLAEQGLLEVDEIDDGGRGTKKRYTVTAAGLDDLRAWIESPTQHPKQRDPMYLKAAYLEWASPDAVRTLMKEHIAFHTERLMMLERVRNSLKDGTHETLSRRMTHYPPEQHERILAWKVFTYDGLIEQAQHEIDWAKRGLALVDTLGDLPPLEPLDD